MDKLVCCGSFENSFFAIQSHTPQNSGQGAMEPNYSLYVVDSVPKDFSPRGVEAFLTENETRGWSVVGDWSIIISELQDVLRGRTAPIIKILDPPDTPVEYQGHICEVAAVEDNKVFLQELSSEQRFEISLLDYLEHTEPLVDEDKKRDLEQEPQCRCKACGLMIDMDDEESLWGHLQLDHEDLFEECQDWDTPYMIEEYYDTVNPLEADKEQANSADDKREELPIESGVMRINTDDQCFDMQKITNRRFMFDPKTATLVLGRQYGTVKGVPSSHAEELAEAGITDRYDDFISGWVGTGRSYPYGVIHFAPSIDQQSNIARFERAFDTLEMFARNGAVADTLIRGFGLRWEQPLFAVLTDSTEKKQRYAGNVQEPLEFIFDDEIMVSDDMTKLEGYLCALSPLVDRLKEQEPPLTKDQIMENINFYPVFDIPNKSISLEGHYYLEDGFHAIGKGFTLPLSGKEASSLITAFEAYCKKKEGKSCLAFLNTMRQQHGLAALSQKSLMDQIQSASSRAAETHQISGSNEKDSGFQRQVNYGRGANMRDWMKPL